MATDTDKPQPFHLNVPDSTLAHIRAKIRAFPWEQMPAMAGWEAGTNRAYLKSLCDYWVTDFDWATAQARINQFDHFTVPINGIPIHYIHLRGSGANPRPLLLSHGWPGSICEFLDILEPLAHPERFGGNSEDSFDIIAPSLPGFAFSGAPPRPYGPRQMAGVLNTLMTDVLGYDTYMAQGGDWGGAICSWLGFDHAAHCTAIHINILTMRHPNGPQTDAERAWARQFDRDQIMQDGYRTQQATKPQTLAYAMIDNPIAVAAWLIEKFTAWSDVPNNDVEAAHSKDALLTNIMIYLVTNCFATAAWIYYGRREEGGRIFSPEGDRVEVPTGCALFPAEMLAWPPRSYVDRLYNVTHWTEMPRGGHFAAMEEGALLVDDIRAFARTLQR